MGKIVARNLFGLCALAALGIASFVLCTSSVLAQNYGSQFYAYVNFPGENWPAVPVPATSVSIGNPTGIAVDLAGNVYIAGPSIVYKLDPSGMLTRIAGNGHNGFSGDGGPATEALLGFPRAKPYDFIDWPDAAGSLAVDAVGNLYLADMFNNRVRKITLDGVISTVAGDGDFATLWLPEGVATDSAGRLYISDGTNVKQFTQEGVITSLTGNDCGSHESPGVCAPLGVAVDASGNIYVADDYCRVRKISADGMITTFAGNENPDGHGFVATCGYSGDGGPAMGAAMTQAYSVAVDAAGDLYIADTYNNRIRKVSPDGTITTVAGSGASYLRPDYGGYSGDGGPATDAYLNLPRGVAVDAAGNLYIADSENFRVRKVTADGIITTVAGNGVWFNGLIVTGITFDTNNARIDGSFDATISGSNLVGLTYFDVRFRAPGGSADLIALNWQAGPSASHTIPAGSAIGTWTINGVRAHQDAGDHTGSFVPVFGSITVTP